MNKSFMGKKLLSLLLSVLMCLSLIPSVALATIAEGETVNVAKIGDTEYATLQKAITAATADDTVVLTDNITLSSYQSISKKVTLDLNGKTLSSTAIYTIYLSTNGDLTVKDSNGEGKICNEYSKSSAATTVYLKKNNTKFTLESGTIESNSNIANSYAIRIENKTTGTVNINGGKVIVPMTSGFGISAGANAVVNINNGEITRGSYAVNMTGGSAVINGGTLTSSNDFALHISGSAAVTVGSLDAETIPVINGIKFESNGTDIPDITLVKGKITKVFCMDPKYKYDSFIFTIPDGASLEFGDDSVKPFLPENVTLTENEDGTYSIGASKTYVAKIGDSVYATLKEAFDAVTDDTATTIKLLADCSGDGIQVVGGKNITVDFDGHTYTVDGETVGSAGTKTNGFQLLATSNITFKNGSIVSSKARILIQSYSNLTIENMTLDLSEQPLYGYTLSNNNGVTVINNSTIKAPLAEGSMAFDACSFASYGDTTVTLKGNSVIEGDVVFSNESTVNSNVTLNLEGGTIKGELSPGTGAEKVTVKKSEAVSVPAPSGYEWTTVDGVQTLVKLSYVAEVNGVKYETLQAAIDAAKSKATVTLVSNTKENVTIAKQLTLDLNGYTLNGGTVKGKPALTITARVTVKDSSTAQTGTIMREDTAENSGVSSHYVIDVQGGAWVLFEGGNVKNNSGNSEGKGASLVRIGDDSVAKYPGLNIKGGTFTQDNFIAIKVDRGDLFLNGGTINSANSYAIENWFRATVKGGTVNGDVASWTYSGGANSTLEITGGTINGNVTSVNYGNAEDKKATVKITGGTVNGELDTRSYDPKTGELTAIDDAKKAAIEVSSGTFTNDPTAYLVESSSITVENGKYSVAKAYLAKVGVTQYYTMEEAFEAQTASGEDIVLLRDYKTAGTFNSGSIKRTVDLNGHTWTYTGTGINDAAFEINHPNATLTVKNGKVISNTLVGLIPSAMGGTIKYDNSTLIFENVEMISNGHSGIETNGNNTNDTVTLKNSTLNVPNGYGIYFASSGTLNIENSAINAKTMGVQVCAGSLNISGDSKITVTGDPVAKTENDGAIQDAAAVSVVNRPGYKGLVEVTITGGTFKSAKGEALKAYKWENKEESAFDLSVIAVSGGTFSSAVPEDYCEEGFISSKNDNGTYTVKAGAYVAEVGGVKYESLEAAYAAAADNATITLLADCYSDRINLENKNIKLVLNGHTVTSTAAYGVLFCVKNGKTITIDGTVAGSKVVGTIMITANTYGHIVINGGTYESALYCPIYVNGAVSNDESTVKITNAVITALRGNSDQDNGVAVYLAGYATSTFTNCTISAPVTGIEIRAGKLDLINCDVTGGNGEIMTSANGNGTTVANAAVAVSQHNTKKAIELNITGGTYTGTAAVYQTNVQGTGSDGVKVNISSGTFNGLVKAETTNVMAISGGTFSSAVPADYCAAGYAPKANNDGTYGVEPKVTTEKRNLSVDINGAGKVEYSINGSDSGIWSNSITKVPYEIGTQFTVKAVPRDGSTFLYWVNSEGRVISDAPRYSFYLGDNLTIKAVFCYSEESAYVTFRDMGNTILMAISADSDGYVNVPTNLIAYAGYTFIGWYDANGNKYEEENGRIKVNGNAAITIYAKYKADTETLYTVTVDDVEKGKYTYGSYVTVTAEDIEGKEFAGWYINGTLVSYDKAYSFYVTGDVALEARYSDTVVVKEPVITLLVSERKETGNGSQYIIFTAAWSADSSYTFVEAGIILAKDNSKELTLENVDNSTILKTATRLTTIEGTYAHTLTLSSAAAKANAVYARAYFTFIKDGKVVTIYTTVQISEPI